MTCYDCLFHKERCKVEGRPRQNEGHLQTASHTFCSCLLTGLPTAPSCVWSSRNSLSRSARRNTILTFEEKSQTSRSATGKKARGTSALQSLIARGTEVCKRKLNSRAFAPKTYCFIVILFEVSSQPRKPRVLLQTSWCLVSGDAGLKSIRVFLTFLYRYQYDLLTWGRHQIRQVASSAEQGDLCLLLAAASRNGFEVLAPPGRRTTGESACTRDRKRSID